MDIPRKGSSRSYLVKVSFDAVESPPAGRGTFQCSCQTPNGETRPDALQEYVPDRRLIQNIARQPS